MAKEVVTLDSSVLIELLNRAAPQHDVALSAFMAEQPPYLIPAGILGELTYMVERRLGPAILDALLEDIESGAYSIECGEADLSAIRELLKRYADLSLGFSDAAVVACAQRSGGRVMTFDLRDFGPIARDGRITLVPSS